MHSFDLLCPKCYRPAKVTRTMRARLDVATGRQPCCRLATCTHCGHSFLRYEDTIDALNRMDLATSTQIEQRQLPPEVTEMVPPATSTQIAPQPARRNNDDISPEALEARLRELGVK